MAKQFVYDATLGKKIEIDVDNQESADFEQSIVGVKNLKEMFF